MAEASPTHPADTYDVCIVGCGPAGASASLFLAEMGIPHLILDKAIFPRDKTCGDGLILHVFKTLAALKKPVLKRLLNDPRFIHGYEAEFQFSQWQKLAFDFKPYSHKFPHAPFLYGKRIDFDDFLVQQLNPQKAKLKQGAMVNRLERKPNGVEIEYQHQKQRHKIKTKLVIGADGAHSKVARDLNKSYTDKNHQTIFVNQYFKNIKDLPHSERGRVRLIYKKETLYFYIFPLPDNLYNVSIGGRSKQVKKYQIDLKKELYHLIKHDGEIAHYFREAEPVGTLRKWIIPLGTTKQPISGDRVLLVGDAAGLANPLYKEGIGSGMFSGMVAAKYAAKALKADCYSAAQFEGYRAEIHRELDWLINWGDFFRKLGASHWINRALVSMSVPLIDLMAQKLIRRWAKQTT